MIQLEESPSNIAAKKYLNWVNSKDNSFVCMGWNHQATLYAGSFIICAFSLGPVGCLLGSSSVTSRYWIKWEVPHALRLNWGLPRLHTRLTAGGFKNPHSLASSDKSHQYLQGSPRHTFFFFFLKASWEIPNM